MLTPLDHELLRHLPSQFKDPSDPWPNRPLLSILSSPRFYVPYLLSFPICLCYYLLVTRLFRDLLNTERRKAWVLTLLSAIVMIAGASPLALEFAMLPTGATIADHPSLDSARAWTVGGFFVGYLTVDLALGMVCYPTQIHPLSGWFHHLGYAWCVLAMMQRGQVGAFLSFAAVLEIPTIPLALGHMNKEWRRDYTFGILFFITRVILHFYVVLHAFTTYTNSIFPLVPLIPLPLHIYWFTNWVRQQLRTGRAPKTRSVPSSSSALQGGVDGDKALRSKRAGCEVAGALAEGRDVTMAVEDTAAAAVDAAVGAAVEGSLGLLTLSGLRSRGGNNTKTEAAKGR